MQILKATESLKRSIYGLRLHTVQPEANLMHTVDRAVVKT